MCQNANKSAFQLMQAIEPTFKALISFAGVPPDDGSAAVIAYDVALRAVQNWQNGTPATEALDAINAFTDCFNRIFTGPLASSIPPGTVFLVDMVLAGLQAVIAVLDANQPAPAAPAGVHPDEAQEHHRAMVVHRATVNIKKLVPGFRYQKEIWGHNLAREYKKEWNVVVDEQSLPAKLKV